MQEILHLTNTASLTFELSSKARLPDTCITGYATTPPRKNILFFLVAQLTRRHFGFYLLVSCTVQITLKRLYLRLISMDVNNIPVNAIQEYDADSKTFSLRAETLPCGMSGPRVMGPEDWCGP